jgi:2-aminoadipate transaminase
MTTKWESRYAGRTEGMSSSVIREILKFTQLPDVVSFAGGMPAPEMFPIERVAEATQRVLAESGAQALQYGLTEGYLPLRQMIVRHMQRYGILAREENVLITAGSQQALDLIGKVLIDPGDRIVVERPTYLGALQAWNAYQAEYVTVPMDDEGMCTDALEGMLRTDGAKFIYALPNFQNPSGVTMSHARREELVRLADTYNIPIVEDDPYGQLRYEGEHLPPLVTLDAGNMSGNHERYITGNVIYLSTFSKTLAPGFRVAWMVGPEDVVQKVVQAKQSADLHTGTLAQTIVYETARGGFLDQHVKRLCEVYRERRDLMLGLMDELFPPGVTWARPEGGLFMWVTLPEGTDATELLKEAVKHKVAFVPGKPFYPGGGGENTFRLNFSNAGPQQIEIGMQRLADVLKQHLRAAMQA